MFGGVDLGAAGLGVVEVAPREHAHPVQAGLGGDVAELGDLDVVAVGIRARAFDVCLDDADAMASEDRPRESGNRVAGPRPSSVLAPDGP